MPYGGILGRTAAAISPPPMVAQGRDRYQNVGLGLGRPANRTPDENMERFTNLRVILAQGPC